MLVGVIEKNSTGNITEKHYSETFISRRGYSCEIQFVTFSYISVLWVSFLLSLSLPIHLLWFLGITVFFFPVTSILFYLRDIIFCLILRLIKKKSLSYRFLYMNYIQFCFLFLFSFLLIVLFYLLYFLLFFFSFVFVLFVTYVTYRLLNNIYIALLFIFFFIYLSYHLLNNTYIALLLIFLFAYHTVYLLILTLSCLYLHCFFFSSFYLSNCFLDNPYIIFLLDFSPF